MFIVRRESTRPRPGDSSTVTAASLIDAIITHQINQPSDAGVSATASQSNASPHVPSARPGDKLFQVNIRNIFQTIIPPHFKCLVYCRMSMNVRALSVRIFLRTFVCTIYEIVILTSKHFEADYDKKKVMKKKHTKIFGTFHFVKEKFHIMDM